MQPSLQLVATTGRRSVLLISQSISHTVYSLTHLLMELTLGIFSDEQTPSDSSRSRISHANTVGFSCLYCVIASTTGDVATFGFDPPMTPGLTDPVW